MAQSKQQADLKDFYSPPNLLEEQKPFILIEIPFCDKFLEFTNKFKISIKWITKKSDKVFSIKGQKYVPLL